MCVSLIFQQSDTSDAHSLKCPFDSMEQSQDSGEVKAGLLFIQIFFSRLLSLLPYKDKAQLIKTQIQILGFNLKVRKAKHTATDPYFDLILKMVILPPGISE